MHVLQGKWHNVLEFAGHYKAAAAAAAANTTATGPQNLQASIHLSQHYQQRQQQQDAELAFTTFKVHALMRLRRFAAAGNELAQLPQDCWSLPGQQQQQTAGEVACLCVYPGRPCSSCSNRVLAYSRHGSTHYASLSYSTIAECIAACMDIHHPGVEVAYSAASAAGNAFCVGVPFGLLYLRAQLPACQGNSSLTRDLLHDLRCYCQQQLQWQVAHRQQLDIQSQKHAQQQEQQQNMQSDVAGNLADQQAEHKPSSTAAAAAAAALWQHRLCGVTCSLVLHYWQAGSVAAALRLLDDLLLLQPADWQLWSLAGRLFLQLNVLKQAHRCFTKVQEIVQQQQQDEAAGLVQLLQLVHHNWGCYHALNNNMTAALLEFDTAQQLTAAAASKVHDRIDGTNTEQHEAAGAAALLLPAVDGVALANSAVCLLHMGQLTEAISCLEAGLQQHPADVAQVGKLCGTAVAAVTCYLLICKFMCYVEHLLLQKRLC
jgi:tetratricopeptide (TPR) repeat protein